MSDSNAPRVRLLGPIEVAVGDEHLPVAGLRRRALLAALALEAGKVVGVDQLVDIVWNSNAPATAVNTLQRHVSYLRRTLGTPGALVSRPQGYLLELGPNATDVLVAERLLREAGRSDDPRANAARLHQALALWRGRPLADMDELTGFADQVQRLDRLRRSVVQALMEVRLAAGEHAALVPELEQLVAEHQFDEDFHRQLMLALYRAGRQFDAFAVYRDLRDRLGAELGVEPVPALRELELAILRHDESLGLPTARFLDVPGTLAEREAEQELVASALRRAVRERSGGVLVFEGPAGIGKTSLLDHTRTLAGANGFRVLASRGMDLEQEYAWGLARQLFERDLPPDGHPVARALLTGTDQPHGEYPLIHALFLLANDLAAGQPLLIVADDLQWSDVPSTRFLSYLAARIEHLPAVLVIALRPGADRVQPMVTAIERADRSTVRPVAPLTAAGAATLLADILDGEPDADLVEDCLHLTRGNPFLLREVGRRLVVSQGADRMPNVARFVDQQLRLLPAGSDEVARALAVLGDDSTPAVLTAVTDVPLPQILGCLAALRAGELVVSDGEPERFSFVHPLIHTAVYDGIRSDDRARLHLSASREAMRRGDVVRAGTHLLRVPPGLAGGDAAAILTDVADSCLAHGSVDTAVSYLRRYLDEDLADQRLPALVRLGMAERLVDNTQARQHLSAALALESDVERRARLSLALAGTLYFGGNGVEAAQVCRRALDWAPRISTDVTRALQATLVNMSLTTRVGARLASAVTEFAAQEPDSSIGGLMLDGALSMREVLDNRRGPAEERALRAIADDVLIGAPMGGNVLATAWYTLVLCDSPALLPSLESAIAAGHSAGSLRALGPAVCYRSALMFTRGYLDEAVEDGRAAWECFETTSSTGGMPFVGEYLIRALLARGEVAEAQAVLIRLKAACPPSVHWTIYAAAEIETKLALGRTDAALTTTLRLRDSFRRRGIATVGISDWRAPLVRCLLAMGRHEEAREVAHELRGLAAEWGTPRVIGTALRIAATVEQGRRRLDLARQSVEVLTRSEARLELALALRLLGETEWRMGRLEDARTHLSPALDLASVCGAHPLRRDVAAALRRAGREVPDEPVLGPASLTPREATVADLAAGGRSAREIAEVVYLTVDAVERHLGAVYRKLGVHTRAELSRALRP